MAKALDIAKKKWGVNSLELGISKSTLHNVIQAKHPHKSGGQQVFTDARQPMY